MIKISLCTTCHNRAWQLNQVFFRNIQELKKHSDVEWILLNYSSSDYLHDFIIRELPAQPSQLVYVVDKNPKSWNASIANNIVHRLASESSLVLMNLDADNLIGNSIDLIKEKMLVGGTELVQMWSKDTRDGTYGRIAITKKRFYEIGGYDESFFPMGYQDVDIMKRARKAGASFLEVTIPLNMAIKNAKADSTTHCNMPGLTWYDFDRLNREKSNKNITSGKFRINNDWLEPNVEIFRGGS